MNLDKVRRNALSQELKFYHSSSVEYKSLVDAIADLDRKIASYKREDSRHLPKDVQRAILSTPVHKR